MASKAKWGARAHSGWSLTVGRALLSSTLACSPSSVPLSRAQATAHAEPPGAIRHVIVISIDGLMPDSYLRPDAHALRVPVLRSLVRRGASSDGALSVFPSLTYPAHTSIASGVTPGRHGIVTNSAFDPLEKNQDAWRWYDEEVKVPRVWDVARAAGYRTALIDWPATVGEAATFHVPEVWRARVSEDLKLIRALSTPGLLENVAAAYPNFSVGFQPQDVADEAGADIAAYLIATAQPHLMFLHVWQVDAAQHKYGLWSDEARAAIENADVQLGRLQEATERAGIGEQTAWVVASDHGFASVTRCVNPKVLLREAGLLALDAQGHVSDWEAALLPAHGAAYVYLKRPADPVLQAATLNVFEGALRASTRGIARLLRQPEIAAIGGDPDAFLALEAAPGTYFGSGQDEYETPPAYRATHGYTPTRPEMKASLILVGPGIAPGTLSEARLVDIAPTVADWLALPLPHVEGKPLVGHPTGAAGPAAGPVE